MENEIIIGTALNGHVRIHLANTTKMVEDARKVHDLYPTSAATLGRTLSVTAIMAMQLKGEGESVTVTINGGGPIGTVMAKCISNGDCKGFVGDGEIYLKYNDSGKPAVGKAVGTDGYLSVTKDLRLKEKYTSKVALQSGEIGDDFAYYFMISEQRPTITSVGVLVDTDYSIKSAGAMVIELLPDAREEDIVYLENLAKDLKPISETILEYEDLHEYLKKLFPDFIYLESQDVRYHCDCSRERFLDGLLTLSEDDLKELLNEDDIKIKCEFCDKEYHFSPEEVMKYVSDRKG